MFEICFGIVQQNGTKDIDEVQQNFDNSESKGQIYWGFIMLFILFLYNFFKVI